MRKALGTSALAAVFSALAGGQALAQEARLQTVSEEEEITVTATRTESDTFEVPSVVTVITADEIENNLAADIKDMIRFEPGVSVPSGPQRFTAALASTGRDGNSSFNIRGIGGNRVLFQVDGVRVPDGFSFGPNSFGRGDYVDIDLLQSVEILRGPGSALYGSDGLAGVVSFITRDPSDFLQGDETFAARARVSYASADDSWAGSLIGAGSWGDWSALVAYTRREGHETENQGDIDAPNVTRTAPNPSDFESQALLARLVFAPSSEHRFRLTADYGDRSIYTEALSARAIPPLGATSVLDLDGFDESERTRYTLDYTYESPGGLIDGAFAAIYYQTSSLYQFADEDRNTAADRTRSAAFNNDVWGASFQLESSFVTGGASHRLTYGGDYSVLEQEGLRNGTVPPVGETFPTRPFPNTEYELAGLFIQDEISFMEGRVVFFPAVRYDAYDLDPTADAFYTLPVAGQSDSRVTPRFGVVAWPTEVFGVFFNYAQGFRAPSPSQVNNNFANPLIGYISIPNPDLQPETSESAELGVRFRDISVFGGEFRATGTAFMGQYEDFIEQVQVSGSFTPLDPAVFQYINLGEVEIWGLEGRADITWANGFGFTAAASFAEGDSISGGARAPLESIDPFKFVAGLSYNDPNGRWGGQLIATHVAQKEDDETLTAFRPDAFTILDVTAYWNLTDAATLRVGVFNLTDETYWWWNDVRGVTSLFDAYTQPGVNYSASISYRF